MSGLTDITFLRPLWGLAVPVVLALMVWRLRRGGQPGDWQTHIQPHLLAAMAALGKVSTAQSRVATTLPFVVAGIVAVALCGPAVERKGAQTFRNLDGVVFVMDVSGSMTRDPIWPKIVTMARGGLSVLGSKPAALIVYAGDSYLASPLTIDHAQLGQSVSLLDAKTVPDKGNRPALALDRAAGLLEEAQVLAGEVILLTDGEGLEPPAIRAAERITQTGAQLSVVVADTTVSGTRPAGRDMVDTLVSIGGGRLYQPDNLTGFMADLSVQVPARVARQDLQLLLLTDFGRYLLVLAMVPALMLFRRDRT
ncbi:vWA domain-containing protein [Yoonia sediminilitoris]|uniref:Ca-activated chloride channel family protein n=1 Tax=Yoonia sediminilitoris TaxID=1286148 RepID=A0A2T6KS96_9RHOB|nr:VWA domain-containing protein [Yoonia sediminilitoris]PUB19429.1 Ca-activated chloride channel family protein [Yoonia sediminilitoris]RCW99597.1 Ca-activated chloride channel family protein [Yoonia sediminilitoris]